MNNNTITYLIRIKGRVQGIGFRYFAVSAASRYKIKGYVRNLAGGDVEVCAQGEKTALEPFLETLRDGSELSRVTGFDIEQVQSSKECFTTFEVRY